MMTTYLLFGSMARRTLDYKIFCYKSFLNIEKNLLYDKINILFVGQKTPCNPNPCNQGKCQESGNSYICDCPPGSSPPNCDQMSINTGNHRSAWLELKIPKELPWCSSSVGSVLLYISYTHYGHDYYPCLHAYFEFTTQTILVIVRWLLPQQFDSP